MARTQRISIARVIARVIDNLNMQDVSPLFGSLVEWAFEAEHKIGGPNTFILNHFKVPDDLATLDNNRLPYPDDFVNVEAVFVGNAQFSESWVHDYQNLKHGEYFQQGNFIYFGQDYTMVDLHYWAVHTDAEGYPTIPESHVDAVAHYLMYKLKAREYYNGKTPRYVYGDLKSEWNRLCGNARAQDIMGNELMVEQSNQIMQNMFDRSTSTPPPIQRIINNYAQNNL